MPDWLAALVHCLRRFGRPDSATLKDDDAAEFDERISTLERRQRDIKARLRLLEIQGTPRGRPRG